jgi:hypothetical protein
MCCCSVQFELWGPTANGAPSIPSLLASLISGAPVRRENIHTCAADHSQFLVRINYLRVDPLTSNITMTPLTLNDCPADCNLEDFMNLFRNHVPHDIKAECALPVTTVVENPDLQREWQERPDANQVAQAAAAENAEEKAQAQEEVVPDSPRSLHTVFTLGRHGDRSPKTIRLSSPKAAPEKRWKSAGLLTRRGFLQEYAVGMFLRQRYLPNYKKDAGGGFCSDALKALIRFRALNLNRTMSSAYALAAGVFDTVPGAENYHREWTHEDLVATHDVEPLLNMSRAAFPHDITLPDHLRFDHLQV